MGSSSDLETVQGGIDILKEFGVDFEVKVLSAHRTPNELKQYVSAAEKNGTKIFIAAAGGSAALAGVVASHTTMPVIGIPIETKSLGGMDSLLSTVQMPAGIPVAGMAIGSAGAKNAALFAIGILNAFDGGMKKKMRDHRSAMRKKIVNTRVKV
jgi:5-(carboxyamino)imidazole ribonucleotide mutase